MSTVTLRLSQVIGYLPPAFMQRCYSGNMTIVTDINTLFCTVKLHPSWPSQLQPRALRDLEEPSQGEGIHLLHQWSKEHWVCRYTYKFTYSVKQSRSLAEQSVSKDFYSRSCWLHRVWTVCLFLFLSQNCEAVYSSVSGLKAHLANCSQVPPLQAKSSYWFHLAL